MKLVPVLKSTLFVLLFSTANVVAEEVSYRALQIGSSAELPEEILKYWQETPDDCAQGFNPDQDLVADFGATAIVGREGSKLFILPCGSPAAYNATQILLSANFSYSQIQLLAIPSIGEEGIYAETLGYGLQWDEETSRITSYYKGRGLGDCGSAGTYKWPGDYYSSVVLVEQFAKDECDGENTDWPQVWPPAR